MARYAAERHTEPTTQSVVRAIDVLTCFSIDHPEWRVTELADYLGYPKSAVYRYLQSFTQAGLVEQTPQRGYRLGLKALELGNIAAFQTAILQAAEEPLRHLAMRTGFSAHLAELVGRDVLELCKALPPGTPRPPSRVLRKAAHATALGKVLLAWGGTGTLDRYMGLRRTLQPFTSKTVTNPNVLRRQLEEILRTGYAVDCEESAETKYCIAVPLMDSHGQVVAAISVSATTDKLGSPTQRHCLPLLLSAKRVIERSISVRRTTS